MPGNTEGRGVRSDGDDHGTMANDKILETGEIRSIRGGIPNMVKYIVHAIFIGGIYPSGKLGSGKLGCLPKLCWYKLFFLFLVEYPNFLEFLFQIVLGR